MDEGAQGFPQSSAEQITNPLCFHLLIMQLLLGCLTIILRPIDLTSLNTNWKGSLSELVEFNIQCSLTQLFTSKLVVQNKPHSQVDEDYEWNTVLE